jgi:hypothetical protein
MRFATAAYFTLRVRLFPLAVLVFYASGREAQFCRKRCRWCVVRVFAVLSAAFCFVPPLPGNAVRALRQCW